MALDFTRQPNNSNQPTQTVEQAQVQTVVNQPVDNMEVVPYDINQDRQALSEKYTNSKEVDEIAGKIEVYNLDSIVSFGSEAAEEIAKCSDQVISSMSIRQLDDSGVMLTTLARIMEKFDIKEIKEDPGFFGKLFGGVKKQLDKILDKYKTMGDEVDKIYIQLKKYEEEIRESNKKLEQMFTTNVDYYHELVKYILAGEQGIKELDAYIASREAEYAKTNDNSIQFDLTSLYQAKEMLAQRVHDLRIAENVAMQSIPMLKATSFSNMNLVRKINSAFIITLPVFKQSLAQAVLLKRQKVQAEALSALDQKTNEMLIRNAQNTANQARDIARLSSGSSIKIETLEETWKTIMQGIQDTRQIQDEAKRKREEDTVRHEAIKKEFNDKFNNK